MTEIPMTADEMIRDIQRRRIFSPEDPEGPAKRASDEWQRIKASGYVPTQAAIDFVEKCTVEAGGLIPARFTHLQYLNKYKNR